MYQANLINVAVYGYWLEIDQITVTNRELSYKYKYKYK